MNFDKSLEKIAILFVFFSNFKDCFLVDELILIKKVIWDNRRVDILILLVCVVLLLFIIVVMNF
jgi:hypothetical protein